MTKRANSIFQIISGFVFLHALTVSCIVRSNIQSMPPGSLIKESKQKNIGNPFRIIVKYYDTTSGSKQLIGRIKYGSEFPDTKIAKIWSLHIKKNYRSQGYGSYMLQQAMEHLKELEFTTVSLDAIPKHKNLYPYLKAFYERHGFNVIEYPKMSADLTKTKT
jgi:ribosomal protein S18 acetylase RimI-like enzyme